MNTTYIYTSKLQILYLIMNTLHSVSQAGDGQRRILQALFNNSVYSIYDRPVLNETETLNVKIE